MWPDWLDNLGNKAKSTYHKTTNYVKNTINNLPKVKVEAKFSIGIQGGIKTPAGAVEFAPARLVANKVEATFNRGNITDFKSTIFNQTTNVQTGKVNYEHSGFPIESKLGISMFQTGVEGGANQYIDKHGVSSDASSYVQTKILGATLNRDPEKASATNSYNLDFGAAFIAGIELNINITPNK